MLDHAEIAARLPHAGRMCLLHRVLYWDEHSIRCTAISHRDPDNPLRVAGGLATLAGIEYAAQAAGVHASLLSAAQVPRNGVLAALRNVATAREWLHDVADEIVVEVSLLHSDAAGGIFSFALVVEVGAGEPVLSGQFTLMYIEKNKANGRST